MAAIEMIEGIGPASAQKLRQAGIRTCEALLKRGASRKGRAQIAAASGFSSSQVLMRVRGVGSQYRDLLEASGVDTVKELRSRNAINLTAAMVRANREEMARTGRSHRPPGALHLSGRALGCAAQQLPPAITY